MFALLEHQTGPTAAAPVPHVVARPTEQITVHWDLLIETAGAETLLTWRLDRNPLEIDADIAAQRLPDHRRIYLEYEGEISDGRGWVRRLERGAASIERLAGDEVEVRLEGARLRGVYEIVHNAAGALVFRRRGGRA